MGFCAGSTDYLIGSAAHAQDLSRWDPVAETFQTSSRLPRTSCRPEMQRCLSGIENRNLRVDAEPILLGPAGPVPLSFPA